MATDAKVGEVLRALRNRAGMTQQELVKRLASEGLQIHQQTIQRIESGKRPLRMTEAFTITAALGIELEDFYAAVADDSDLLRSVFEFLALSRHVNEAVASYIEFWYYLRQLYREEQAAGKCMESIDSALQRHQGFPHELPPSDMFEHPRGYLWLLMAWAKSGEKRAENFEGSLDKIISAVKQSTSEAAKMENLELAERIVEILVEIEKRDDGEHPEEA